MSAAGPEPNPARLPGAPLPRIERVEANGTHLYAEIRGAGAPILIIPGGAEDAEGWRPVAERLPDDLVVTYDRRGTRRSGRDDWPGGGSAQHADDADGLLDALGIEDAVIFGASSGGVIALELALRHPRRVRRALIFEPGCFRNISGGEALLRPVMAAMRDYLDRHPADWLGAYDAFVVAAGGPSAVDDPQFLSPPAGSEWYSERERSNAEALVRDDAPILTHEIIDELRLAQGTADTRFAYGSESPRIFREITSHLAGLRGTRARCIEGVGHAIYHHPHAAAAYILSQAR